MALLTEAKAPQQRIRRVLLGGVHVRNTREHRSKDHTDPYEFTIPRGFAVDLSPDLPIIGVAEHPQDLDIDELREIITAATSISIPDTQVAIRMPNGLDDTFQIESADWATAQLLQFYVETHTKGFSIHQHIGDSREHIQAAIHPGEQLTVTLTAPSLDAKS